MGYDQVRDSIAVSGRGRRAVGRTGRVESANYLPDLYVWLTLLTPTDELEHKHEIR